MPRYHSESVTVSDTVAFRLTSDCSLTPIYKLVPEVEIAAESPCWLYWVSDHSRLQSNTHQVGSCYHMVPDSCSVLPAGRLPVS